MKLKNEEQGVFNISLVASPANESSFVALKESATMVKFSADEEKRVVTGVVLLPDQKIYRNSGFDKGECEIFFSADTIRQCAELFLSEDERGGASLEHLLPTDSAKLVESWIVEDAECDKAVALGLSVVEGTWCASYKILDNELWESIKSGEGYTGFSIEGLFESVAVEAGKNKTLLETLIEEISE